MGLERGQFVATVFLCCAVATPVEAATIQIVMDNLVISPAEASAKVGDTVEWINKDVFAHTATARNGDFDVSLPSTQVSSFVLRRAGMVDYYCRFHPNMKARLKIEP